MIPQTTLVILIYGHMRSRFGTSHWTVSFVATHERSVAASIAARPISGSHSDEGTIARAKGRSRPPTARAMSGNQSFCRMLPDLSSRAHSVWAGHGDGKSPGMWRNVFASWLTGLPLGLGFGLGLG